MDEELRQNLKVTMQQKYQQPGEESVTQAVDKLQQEVWKWYDIFELQHHHTYDWQKLSD